MGTESQNLSNDYRSNQPPPEACTWCGLATLCGTCFAEAVVSTPAEAREGRKAA